MVTIFLSSYKQGLKIFYTFPLALYVLQQERIIFPRENRWNHVGRLSIIVVKGMGLDVRNARDI